MTTPIRVLLVEDNPGDADLTKETLEEGKLLIELTIVIDGTQALAYLMQQPPFDNVPRPDVMLLDLNLPKMSGIEVLAEMKKHAELRSIPVVVLTSSDAELDVVTSYQLGAACYITKPVGLKAFQAIVRSIEGFWFTVVKLP